MNVEIEGFVVLLLFFWWIRDIHRIGQHLISYLLDDTDVPSAPPWLDAAPYLPDGGCYGYAISQYHYKKKSGHSRPKKGGLTHPITSCLTTHWLTRTTFISALMYVILFGLTSAIMSTCDLSEHPHVIDEVDSNSNNDSTDTPSFILDDEWKIAETPRVFKMWIKPFHWSFSQYLPAYLKW